jgi:small ligand-binding sensory domain FIST
MGNILYEIDGVPALEALKDYLGEDWKEQWNKTTLNICLGFKTPEHMKKDYEEYIVRYLVGKDDREGYVTIQSDVREGSEFWLVRRDKELIRSGMSAISRQIKDKMGDRRPKFVLQFECVGRGKVVFREGEKIDLIKTIQQEIGGDIPWMGFYTYGEIGPIMNFNCFHNFTSVISAAY